MGGGGVGRAYLGGMNAMNLLKQQHRDMDELFEEIEQTEEQEEKQALVQDVADRLAAHATIEEQIFYPAAYGNRTKELTEATEEHLSMKRIIADLMGLPAEDDKFDAKVKVLMDQFRHHITSEENELFPSAEKELDSAELERLGVEMQGVYDEEMVGEPGDAAAGQAGEAAPPR